MSGKDRISTLPESLLHHILSFLGTKDCASSGVLSKRWNSIWTTSPVLKFEIYTSVASKAEKFMNFVDGTMRRNSSSNLDKFILGGFLQLSEPWLHSLISSVISRNVKELILNVRQHPSTCPAFTAPSLFTCESLTYLELGTVPCFRLPEHISFPRLKRLKLNRFEITDESWNEQLFSNSIVLEELILSRCVFRVRNFCISIPTLKLLEIYTSLDKKDGLEDCVLKVDAPKLVTFVFWGFVAKEFVLSSFPALAKATVHIQEIDGVEAISHQLIRAIAVEHVQCLTVNDKVLQVIFSASHLLKNLHNVKMLNISDTVTTDEALISLLKAVPNLESLVFRMANDVIVITDSDEDSCDDTEGDDDDQADDADSVESENHHYNEDEADVTDAGERGSNDVFEENYENDDESWALDVTAGCLFPRLKSVWFKEFVRKPKGMKWVRLILRHAKALQTMTIHVDDSSNCYANTRSLKQLKTEIPRFPRSPPNCAIKITKYQE